MMLWMVVFAPSIKLIYSTSIINVLPVLVLLLLTVLRKKIDLRIFYTPIVSTLLLFTIIVLIQGILSLSSASNDYFKILFIWFSLWLSYLNASQDALKIFSRMVVIWGAGLSAYQLIFGINFNASLGQTYLTLSLPIGAALSISLVNLFISRHTLLWRLFYLATAMLLLLALGSLLSRGALLLSFGTFFCIYSLSILFDKNISRLKKMTVTIAISSLTFLFFMFVDYFLNERQLDRIVRLADNIEDEPRIHLYIKAVEFFMDNPFLGGGLSASEKLYNGGYPHNIFLDIAIHTGLLGLIVFFMFLLVFLVQFVLSLKNRSRDPYSITLYTLAFFLFLQWNISFGFDAVHIPILSMLIACKYSISKFSSSYKFKIT